MTSQTSTTTAVPTYPVAASALRTPPAQPSTFIIFGASGDLTRRKLIPALYNLKDSGLLPEDFEVIGFAVTPMNDDSFREEMQNAVQQTKEAHRFKPDVWEDFADRLHYITADFESPEGYIQLNKLLTEIEVRRGQTGKRLFYLATPPSFYVKIIEKLRANSLVTNTAETDDAWTRIIIEKPFGHDLDSAISMNRAIHQVFLEDQIYRIDHYLGKETVQNIMAFRFANSIIDPIWNRFYIDHVQITAAETLGVEHRGKYYEEAGCLRDMFQNHLLQLFSIVAMDPPVRYGGTYVRDRKLDVLRSIVPINPESLADTAVRGQYGAGWIDGKQVPGYRQEQAVAPESKTETYAALKLFVDNWRWADVPFYLRSGKRMPHKVTEIVIQFKRVPHLFFSDVPREQVSPNLLTIRIQPDEGISLRFGAKMPGPEMKLSQVQMDFSYATAFSVDPSTAYEMLLLDALEGDPTLFNRADTVAACWQVIAPIQEIWGATRSYQPFPNYAAGTWGPSAADTLLSRDDRAWHNVSPRIKPTVDTHHEVDKTGEPMGFQRVISAAAIPNTEQSNQ